MFSCGYTNDDFRRELSMTFRKEDQQGRLLLVSHRCGIVKSDRIQRFAILRREFFTTIAGLLSRKSPLFDPKRHFHALSGVKMLTPLFSFSASEKKKNQPRIIILLVHALKTFSTRHLSLVRRGPQ
jgi:hypothetical protein